MAIPSDIGSENGIPTSTTSPMALNLAIFIFILEFNCMNIDIFDKKLLSILQNNGRISNVELAEAVNLSESACLRRVRSLEERGLIDRYVALLDHKRVGLTDTVFVHIVLKREEKSELEAFENAWSNVAKTFEKALIQAHSEK